MTITDTQPRVEGAYSFKLQGTPELGEFTSKEDSCHEALISIADRSPHTAVPLDNGFDRDFHGDPDGVRVADLATSEGMAGIVVADGSDGEFDFHQVTLARADETGAVQTFATAFSTPASHAPTTSEVLSAILTDSGDLNDVDSVEDWANQYGYDLDEDGPSVRAAYQAVLEQDGRVREFLGEKYDDYLWGDQ